ncbi:UvrB/UvrC motif-containing protein, partial [Patescibacteria group bacterium]
AKELEPVFISDLPKHFSKSQAVQPKKSSWALMKKDIENNTPYARWQDPENEIQQMQWKLTDMAIRQIDQIKHTHPLYTKVRTALDRSIHSDQYWWASAQPWWSIEMIEAGAKELKDVILMSPASSKKEKETAERLYQDIIYTSFDWQRSGKVEARSKSSDEDVTQRISKEAMHIPKKEFDDIINNLSKQMETAANSKEYERAAQLRDRIKELKEKEHEITSK